MTATTSPAGRLSDQEAARTGRCLSPFCQKGCTHVTHLPNRIAGYLYCACGHTALVHARQETAT